MSPYIIYLSPEKTETATTRLHALAHKLRVKILNYIISHPGSFVGDIYGSLSIEQSVCSQHLKILRDAGFVHSERVGKHVQYYYDEELIKKVMRGVNEFLGD